jgi:hypothetical protein
MNARVPLWHRPARRQAGLAAWWYGGAHARVKGRLEGAENNLPPRGERSNQTHPQARGARHRTRSMLSHPPTLSASARHRACAEDHTVCVLVCFGACVRVCVDGLVCLRTREGGEMAGQGRGRSGGTSLGVLGTGGRALEFPAIVSKKQLTCSEKEIPLQ